MKEPKMKCINITVLIIITLLYSLGLTSCNSQNSEHSGISTQRKKADVKEKISNNDIKHKIDDSLFVQRIIDGNFFVDEFSQELDYNLVVRHCLSHTDEQYDETFADGLSKMLVKYPEKIKGILKVISLLPAEQQNRTYHNLKIYIISAWIMGNYTDSIDIDTFYKTYPFFKKDSATDEILKEQIKSIIG